MGSQLSLGVEEELHVIDPNTFRLARRAPALLAKLPPDHYSSELQRTTVEIRTSVCDSLDELRSEIFRLRRQLIEVATAEGLALASVGTVPLSDPGDFAMTSNGRFARMQEDYRLLVEEQLICGTQVHVGVDSTDIAVDVAQRVSRDLPVLLALSASSPLWHGADTGYASIRSIIWQRWPTSGTTGPLASAAEYHELLTDLIASGVITDTKMAYFDVRPSTHVPTVELRVCDACPLVDDVVLIAGLFRALVASAEAARERGSAPRPVSPALHRAAMWRAARSGLSGDLLDTTDRPRPVPAAQAVRGLLRQLRPTLERLDDWDAVSELAEAALSRGTSSDRQRSALAERGQLTDVVSQVMAETAGDTSEVTQAHAGETDYPLIPGDEAFTPMGSVRPVYRKLFDGVERIGKTVLAERLDERDRWTAGIGMTFGVGGSQGPFPVDILPRVIPAHEWSRLTLGLTQRARALEMFLRDVYTDGRIVRDGALPEGVVYNSPRWRDEARHLPRNSVRAPIIGFDLVRNQAGGWHVLEDNARVPSGAGYAVAIRQLMDAVMPDVPRPANLLPSHTAPGLLRQTLRACTAVPNPVIALLSDGPSNSAWFEHRLLAERAGFLLAQAADLAVHGGAVTVLDERVDVLYLRLDVELVDLLAPGGHPIGLDLMRAAVAGAVTVANAPGNGVADDKAMYCFVPDLIAYYLDERSLLDPVPTYRCSDPDEREVALRRLNDLVTKPVDGHGGHAIMVGPHATAAELATRRQDILSEPDRWVAQEVVDLSTHPTFTSDGFQPRHVDLRAFVYLSGVGPDDAHLADLALTRVAPAGSMVVNSSRGGGAKDTWILSAPTDEA